MKKDRVILADSQQTKVVFQARSLISMHNLRVVSERFYSGDYFFVASCVLNSVAIRIREEQAMTFVLWMK